MNCISLFLGETVDSFVNEGQYALYFQNVEIIFLIDILP